MTKYVKMWCTVTIVVFSTILVQRQQYTLKMGSWEFVSSCKNNVIKEGETMRHCMQKKWTMTADLLKKKHGR